MAKTPGYECLNLPIWDSQLFSSTASGKAKYNGDYVEMFDAIIDGNDELYDCILDGTVDGNGVHILVDAHTYGEFVSWFWNSECINNQCINNRLKYEEKTAFGMTKKVYYIDGIPIVPLKYPKLFTKYILGQIRFMYVSTARNIHLGMAFNRMPSVGDGLAGLAVQKATNLNEAGYVYMAAHQLFGKLLRSKSEIAGGQIFIGEKA